MVASCRGCVGGFGVVFILFFFFNLGAPSAAHRLVSLVRIFSNRKNIAGLDLARLVLVSLVQIINPRNQQKRKWGSVVIGRLGAASDDGKRRTSIVC